MHKPLPNSQGQSHSILGSPEGRTGRRSGIYALHLRLTSRDSGTQLQAQLLLAGRRQNQAAINRSSAFHVQRRDDYLVIYHRRFGDAALYAADLAQSPRTKINGAMLSPAAWRRLGAFTGAPDPRGRYHRSSLG